MFFNTWTVWCIPWHTLHNPAKSCHICYSNLKWILCIRAQEVYRRKNSREFFFMFLKTCTCISKYADESNFRTLSKKSLLKLRSLKTWERLINYRRYTIVLQNFLIPYPMAGKIHLDTPSTHRIFSSIGRVRFKKKRSNFVQWMYIYKYRIVYK